MNRTNIEILEAIEKAIPSMEGWSEVERQSYVAYIYNHLIDTYGITSETKWHEPVVDLFERQVYAIPVHTPHYGSRAEYADFHLERHAFIGTPNQLSFVLDRDAVKVICGYNSDLDTFVMSLRYWDKF